MEVSTAGEKLCMMWWRREEGGGRRVWIFIGFVEWKEGMGDRGGYVGLGEGWPFLLLFLENPNNNNNLFIFIFILFFLYLYEGRLVSFAQSFWLKKKKGSFSISLSKRFHCDKFGFLALKDNDIYIPFNISWKRVFLFPILLTYPILFKESTS